MDWKRQESAKRVLRAKKPRIYNDQRLDDEIDGKRTYDINDKLQDKKFELNESSRISELSGKEFDLKYIQENGFLTPVLFRTNEGIGLKMPDPDLFSVIDIKKYVGARRIIDVFDCDTHQPEQMTVHQWVRYYTASKRDKILNVTSLEFSHTELERIVNGPSIINDLDWVSLMWPVHFIREQRDATNSLECMKYPKVRKYVLMSVAGCYTDFHIDFGGSSVWYHLLKGSKVFWLVTPTEKNLQIYEKWVLSGQQSKFFFGDLVENCWRIHLHGGDTLMIPSGWIHGVYTPDDSIVFGGNFLHSFNIPMQLKVFEIEESTHVPMKLKYPYFAEIHWYMIKSYVDVLERDIDEKRMKEFYAESKNGALKIGWRGVCLTNDEVKGLKLVCKRFRKWPYMIQNYPKDLTGDNMDLVDRLEELLQHHEHDDQSKACQGINFFKQFCEDRDDVKNPLVSTSNCPPKRTGPLCSYSYIKRECKDNTDKNKVASSKQKSGMGKNKLLNVNETKFLEKSAEKKKKNVIRRVRCNDCEGCKAENCNKCKFCLDMKKNGGENKLRKSCLIRFCKRPQLPRYAKCKICDKDKNESSLVLLECTLCGQIVHFSCLKKKNPCKFSAINNSWECPKCFVRKRNLSEIPVKMKKSVHRRVNDENFKNLNKVNGIKVMRSETHTNLSKRKDGLVTNKKNTLKAPLILKSKDDDKVEDLSFHSSTTGLKFSQNESIDQLEKLSKINLLPLDIVCPAPHESLFLFCMLDCNSYHQLTKKNWMQIFLKLQTRDLNTCMLVCKAWNQWCMDNIFWKDINVSNQTVTPSMLKGIVRRQPASIDLTYSNISCDQLEWLLRRIPNLVGLNLSMNTASAASSLMKIEFPPLKYLNLSWCDAVYDTFIIQFLSSVQKYGLLGSTQLILIEKLILTGCDISDETVSTILLTLKKLSDLDICYCTRVTGKCFIDSERSDKYEGKETLKRIYCIGCPLLIENVRDITCQTETLTFIVEEWHC